jgi:hypothetical protein
LKLPTEGVYTALRRRELQTAVSQHPGINFTEVMSMHSGHGIRSFKNTVGQDGTERQDIDTPQHTKEQYRQYETCVLSIFLLLASWVMDY